MPQQDYSHWRRDLGLPYSPEEEFDAPKLQSIRHLANTDETAQVVAFAFLITQNKWKRGKKP